MHLADEQQQVCVTGKVHGEEEESELLDDADATLVRQREGQELHLRSLFCHRCLGVQGGTWPFGCPP